MSSEQLADIPDQAEGQREEDPLRETLAQIVEARSLFFVAGGEGTTGKLPPISGEVIAETIDSIATDPIIPDLARQGYIGASGPSYFNAIDTFFRKRADSGKGGMPSFAELLKEEAIFNFWLKPNKPREERLEFETLIDTHNPELFDDKHLDTRTKLHEELQRRLRG